MAILPSEWIKGGRVEEVTILQKLLIIQDARMSGWGKSWRVSALGKDEGYFGQSKTSFGSIPSRNIYRLCHYEI